ncbi:hypothetical protein F511_22755 [Dorcoceras hygrometricum]|uniref:Uncharacterized protein n=1 Tax=Dorcoceras hygrometricum TaxID=472368 RepID=A0A2Z7DEQ3_9LAMI|nr:hypothetical protein F511_22755 [Dorcoceras hygrometricum]
MRTRGDKRPSRKNDRKVLMAEESTKSWADTDSDSSSSSSSYSDSEQEEVHCLMANQTSDDELAKKKLDKDRAKAGRKSFVPNQPWRSSTKDLIGIYGLKGPYCTLTTTDWFLQALSVIPRGSWGDVARLFTMIRWAAQNRRLPLSTHAAAAADLHRKFVSGQFDEENPFVLISSALLVQPDEGVSVLVVDRIGDYLPQSTEKSRVLVIPVGARHKCQQGIHC